MVVSRSQTRHRFAAWNMCSKPRNLVFLYSLLGTPGCVTRIIETARDFFFSVESGISCLSWKLQPECHAQTYHVDENGRLCLNHMTYVQGWDYKPCARWLSEYGEIGKSEQSVVKSQSESNPKLQTYLHQTSTMCQFLRGMALV